MPEIYIATAVETDGPIPGPHSMLSLGSAAYQRDKTLVSTFTVNLETLPGSKGHPDTMAWWKSKPNAWAVCRYDPEPIATAIKEYADWLMKLPGKPVFVGYPAAKSYAFINYYLHRFVGRNPFGESALDLRSFAMALIGKPYHQSRTRHMPEQWIADSPPHTYVTLDDALTVGRMFGHMLDHWKNHRPAPPASTVDDQGTLKLKNEA